MGTHIIYTAETTGRLNFWTNQMWTCCIIRERVRYVLCITPSYLLPRSTVTHTLRLHGYLSLSYKRSMSHSLRTLKLVGVVAPPDLHPCRQDDQPHNASYLKPYTN